MVTQRSAEAGLSRHQMYLEMTPIDNATGHVLWHARQQFPADGSRSEHVREAIAHMLETLPGHRALALCRSIDAVVS